MTKNFTQRLVSMRGENEFRHRIYSGDLLIASGRSYKELRDACANAKPFRGYVLPNERTLRDNPNLINIEIILGRME